jgi:dTDP-4-dehydrorhamnose reductase
LICICHATEVSSAPNLTSLSDLKSLFIVGYQPWLLRGQSSELTQGSGAAQRSPDICSNDPDAARALNVRAAEVLANLTKARSIFLIYISTDYVFPGKPDDAPYESDAPPAPTNEYGQTKLDGERAVLQATVNTGLGISLRVPVLYGAVENGNNSESAVNTLMDVLWQAQEAQAPIKMDNWAQRYPTNTQDVGRVCKDIAEKYLNTPPEDQSKLPTILQFSSEDRLTKYQICEIFAEIMGLPMAGLVANKEGNDPKAAVQRPYDTHLSTRSLKELGIDVSTMDFKAWWYVS